MFLKSYPPFLPQVSRPAHRKKLKKKTVPKLHGKQDSCNNNPTNTLKSYQGIQNHPEVFQDPQIQLETIPNYET